MGRDERSTQGLSRKCGVGAASEKPTRLMAGPVSKERLQPVRRGAGGALAGEPVLAGVLR